VVKCATSGRSRSSPISTSTTKSGSPLHSLRLTIQAERALETLANDAGLRKRHQAVQKTLGLLQTNLRHPGLQTHKYHGLRGVHGEDVFEAYVEHRTAAAYRVFWHYGPGRQIITIVAITSHP
jgi:hypothetical protein